MATNTENKSTAPEGATVEAGIAPVATPNNLDRRTRGAGQDHGKPNPAGRIRNLFRRSTAFGQIGMKDFAAQIVKAAAGSILHGIHVSGEVIKAAVRWITAKAAKPAKVKRPKRVKKTKSAKEPGKLDGKKSKDKPSTNTGTAAATAK